QIAQLALWMRAQRAFRDFGVARGRRPAILRTNIVVAEPMPAEGDLRRDFTVRLGNRGLAEQFQKLVDAMSLAGELGLLLQVETLGRGGVAKGQTGLLFAASADRIREALHDFAAEAAAKQRTVRRLFAEDALAGVGFLEIAEKTFDVVLMNPPFGLLT